MVVPIENQTCPYCSGFLNKIPRSKTRCPNCYNYLFVRTTIDGKRFAVTEEEKEKIDDIRKRARGGSFFFRSAARGASRGCSCLLSILKLTVFIIFISTFVIIT